MEQAEQAAPGSRLLDVVAVMDRLRGPGGCPWDAEQTHDSLTRYLVEETYEVLDAVDALAAGDTREARDSREAGENREAGDTREADLAEELGDVLLQVVFHSRIAADRGAFDVDDVAAALVAKLVRRHPHVFADETQRSGAAVQARWDELKAAEKPTRGPVDGIPRHLPALARADKLLARLERAGLVEPVDPPDPTPLSAEQVGSALFDLVRQSRAAQVDPEAALRTHVARVESVAAGGSRRAI